MISSSSVSSIVFLQGIRHGMWLLAGLEESGWFFIFCCSRTFYFLLIEFHSACSIYYTVRTCRAYYYCILFGFKTLFFCLFAAFLLFSPMGSVMGCDSSLGSFCYSPVYFLSRMHLLSGYYFFDYVIEYVLINLWLTEILSWRLNNKNNNDNLTN